MIVKVGECTLWIDALERFAGFVEPSEPTEKVHYFCRCILRKERNQIQTQKTTARRTIATAADLVKWRKKQMVSKSQRILRNVTNSVIKRDLTSIIHLTRC